MTNRNATVSARFGNRIASRMAGFALAVFMLLSLFPVAVLATDWRDDPNRVKGVMNHMVFFLEGFGYTFENTDLAEYEEHFNSMEPGVQSFMRK